LKSGRDKKKGSQDMGIRQGVGRLALSYLPLFNETSKQSSDNAALDRAWNETVSTHTTKQQDYYLSKKFATAQ
jgi:hypothetical protein